MARTITGPLPQRAQIPGARALLGVLILIVLVGVLAFTGTLTRLRDLLPGASVSTPAYQTAAVSKGNVVIGVTATGPISAVTNVPLSFKGSGKLTALKVNVGDKVTLGQALATLDATDLQTALDQANATLVQSQANLTKVQAGSTSQAIAAAKTTVDNAKQTLLDSQASLASTKASTGGDIAAAQSSVGTAQTSLQTSKDALAAAQDQLVKGIAVDQAAIATDQKSLAAEKATVAADQPILQQQISQAKNSLWSAQISRDATCGNNKGTQCQAANASVAASETAASTALAQLAYSQKQSDQQIAASQATLDQATIGLANDQSKLQASVVSAQNGVKQAQASLATAQGGVGQAQTKAAASVQSSQAQINQASGSQQSAEASYNTAAAPPLQADIDTAKAQVSTAQAGVALAQEGLASATLTAPYAGTIAAVNGSVGQWISGGTVAATTGSAASATAIFTLIDTNNLQVVAQVNEADISKVAVGNPVTFSVAAFAGKTFTGKVLSVQPIGTTVSNVVGYNVTSSVQPVAGSILYPGMTATATIVSAEKDNVLTVPDTAVSYGQSAAPARSGPSGGTRGSSAATGATAPSTSAAGSATGKSPPSNATTTRGVVMTLVQGQPTAVQVTIGLTDGSTDEIVSGLKEGDLVITSDTAGTVGAASRTTSTTTTTSPLSTGGGGRGGGGGG